MRLVPLLQAEEGLKERSARGKYLNAVGTNLKRGGVSTRHQRELPLDTRFTLNCKPSPHHYTTPLTCTHLSKNTQRFSKLSNPLLKALSEIALAGYGGSLAAVLGSMRAVHTRASTRGSLVRLHGRQPTCELVSPLVHQLAF